VKRPRNRVLARAAWLVSVLGLVVTSSVAVASPPAQAASSITVTHSITVPGLVKHQIEINVPMVQSDALGYLVNGARIEVECWGADQFFDDMLPDCPKPGSSGTVTYSIATDPPLVATETGVNLTIVNLYEVGTVLNEDAADSDEIYIKVRWIDGDGATLRAKSKQVVGWF
jgi:hypothetical protein